MYICVPFHLILNDEMTKQSYVAYALLLSAYNFCKKMPCGSIEGLTEREKLFVQWKDNSFVTITTNSIEKYSSGQAFR